MVSSDALVLGHARDEVRVVVVVVLSAPRSKWGHFPPTLCMAHSTAAMVTSSTTPPAMAATTDQPYFDKLLCVVFEYSKGRLEGCGGGEEEGTSLKVAW